MASNSECYHLMSFPDKLEADCSDSNEDSNCIIEMDESKSEKNVVSPHPAPALTQRTSEAADTLLNIFSDPTAVDLFINHTAVESSARYCGGEPTSNPTAIESSARDCGGEPASKSPTIESSARDCGGQPTSKPTVIESSARDCGGIIVNPYKRKALLEVNIWHIYLYAENVVAFYQRRRRLQLQRRIAARHITRMEKCRLKTASSRPFVSLEDQTHNTSLPPCLTESAVDVFST